MKTVAVLNAGGAQAAAIADRVEQAGHEVRRISRSAGPGRTVADPEDVDSLSAAFDDVQGLVFTIPQDYRPRVRDHYAERVVAAAARSGLARIVVNIGGPIFDDLDHPITHDLRRIRETVRAGTVATVVIQPTSFFDNLREPWAMTAIAGGTLPYPGQPQARISWVSHRSLGDFAAAALTADNVEGRIIRVSGPEPLTGPQVAEAVGAAAGHPVTHEEMALADFAAGLNAQLGAPGGDHIAALYGHYADHPEAAAVDPAEWAVLGVVPESAGEWAARQDWSA